MKAAREPEEQRLESAGDDRKLTAILVAGAAAMLGVAGIVWRVTNAQQEPRGVVDEDVPADVVALS